MLPILNTPNLVLDVISSSHQTASYHSKPNQHFVLPHNPATSQHATLYRADTALCLWHSPSATPWIPGEGSVSQLLGFTQADFLSAQPVMFVPDCNLLFGSLPHSVPARQKCWLNYEGPASPLSAEHRGMQVLQQFALHSMVLPYISSPLTFGDWLHHIQPQFQIPTHIAGNLECESSSCSAQSQPFTHTSVQF